MADISVIVPVYNSEKYLSESISSVLEQRNVDLEIILVDDGSMDKSGEICDDLAKKHPFIRVFHTENRGVSAARNFGLSVATGKYLCFLNADDMFLPESLLSVYLLAEENNCDIVSALFTENIETQSGPEEKLTFSEGEDYLMKCIEDSVSTHSACAKLFRRDFVGATLFPEGKKVNEDGFFVFLLALKNPRVALINKPIYFYRTVSGSASRSVMSEKYLDIISLSEEKIRLISEKYPHLSERAKNISVKASLALLRIMATRGNGGFKKEERKAIKTVKQNKKYFIKTNKSTTLFFYIIVLNLYHLYKLYHYLRKQIKKIFVR